MEGMAELSQEAVLRFLAERGGRVRNAELVDHFKGSLGGEPEQRARAREHFKQLVNAVATVRTDPADGAKYVHLKKKFSAGLPPPEEAPAPAATPPRISVTEEPRDDAPVTPEDPLPAAAPEPPEHPEPGGLNSGDPRGEPPRPGQRPPQGTGVRKRNSRRSLQPLPRGPPAGPGDELEPPGPGWEEAEGGGLPGAAITPRSTRKNFRELVMGSSPQLKRSFFAGAGSRKGGGDSDSASLASSSAEEESSGGSVTLDPLEHAWMLSAADPQWDSLEGLLSCEPSLLAKRDFITGFTCLHWAAKHGRPELLARLVSFATKQQLPVDINARTSAGYTALHLAAMHGHVEVVKLLVGAYDADVDIRDYSGRKASHYLDHSIAEEIRNLVGALDEGDPESAAGSSGGRWKLSRVLPSHLITHKMSHALEDGGNHHHHLAEAWAGGKAKDSGRKAPGSSSGRLRPRFNKIRFRTQIVHTTPSLRDLEQPLEEEEEEQALKNHSFKLRPKSNVFG
ncbi:PREDICTED: ankyrin repeat domain-containing protein SOWAHC-like [Elephantulus edwardii]|uniref:ankyrin repeat domain-containing protein SOWAHC-like n=1 Tax=Elephantulus edwardii TaxID=28737 RepID=UPI0003F0E4A1|nr:PREDICTED: ankyrin repeat domain-containing protein SOWAHC-like [Elephantulus edwardii]